MSLRSLISASALFTIGILVGRVLGLLRETLLAARFGSSEEANIAIALLIIPDFITAALVGSALGAVLIPAFAKRSEEEIMALFWQTLWVSIAAFLLLAMVFIVSIPSGPDHHVLQVVFISLPFVGATSALTVYLQYRGRFVVPAFASAIFNAIVLLTLWLSPSDLMTLAMGVVAAVLIRLMAHIIAFIRAGGKKATNKKWQLGKPLFVAYLQTAGANLLGILPFYLPFAIVASLSIGGFAVFNYAFKLLLFPATLVQTVIQMVLLPWFVKLKAESTANSRERYSLSLQLGWIISLAVALSVSLAGQDIADLAFGYGKMTENDIHQVGVLISIGIWSTPGIVLLSIWQQMLYAHGHTKPVLMANFFLVATLMIMCISGGIVAESNGITVGFVIAFTLPTLLLAYHNGKKIGIARKPSYGYVSSAVSMLVVFVPVAWLHHSLNNAPLTGLLLCMLAGLMMLVVGMLQVRQLKDLWREHAPRWLRLHR